MNCHDFENNVLALARGELIDNAVRVRCLSHSEECVQCARRLEEERTLLAGVHAVVAEVGKTEAPSHVQASLLMAFRQQATAAPLPSLIPLAIRHRYLTRWRVAAIAAGILLIFSVVIFWWGSNTLDHEREARKESSVPSETPGAEERLAIPPTVEHGGNIPHQSVPRDSQRHIRRLMFRKSLNEVEEVTQFFALREGEDLSSLDGVRLVRVELPSSALSEVGLPVSPEATSSRVKADVVLGQDGAPLAIRFIR